MFDKQKYHEAVDTLAEQLVEMIKEEYPEMTYEQAVGSIKLTSYLSDTYEHLDQAVCEAFEKKET